MWDCVEGFRQVKEDGADTVTMIKGTMPVMSGIQQGLLGGATRAKAELSRREERIGKQVVHESIVNNVLKDF